MPKTADPMQYVNRYVRTDEGSTVDGFNGYCSQWVGLRGKAEARAVGVEPDGEADDTVTQPAIAIVKDLVVGARLQTFASRDEIV